MLNENDVAVLRRLAAEYADIAALPVHAEKRGLWREHNEFRQARPMVLIDQVCWQEFRNEPGLEPVIEDPYWRELETGLRRKLYSWAHMPVDMVFNPYISLPKPIHSTGWGLEVKQDKIMLEENATAASYHFHNVLRDYDDLEKIHAPEITLDADEMARIKETADKVFGGIIPYRMEGLTLHLGVWDTISQWMGVENCYIDIIDRPEFIHAIMEKLTDGLMSQIEQINRQGLYDVTSNIVHCSHNFLDDLPSRACDPDHGVASEGWAFGLAQLFTSVSPSVTDEFEVQYMKRVFPHFGAIYYGCCERLDDRLDILEKLPNVRKISCSPFSEYEHFAEALPPRRIMSAKPNPAYLAWDSFDEDAVRGELRERIGAAKRYGRNIEFLLKDISTVKHDPSRLWRWAEIAMEEVQR